MDTKPEFVWDDSLIDFMFTSFRLAMEGEGFSSDQIKRIRTTVEDALVNADFESKD